MRFGRSCILNSSALLIAVVFAYCFLPWVTVGVLDTTYIFATEPGEQVSAVALSGVAFLALFYAGFRSDVGHATLPEPRGAPRRVLAASWRVTVAFSAGLLVWGIVSRLALGAERTELLANEHQALFPGLGILLILALCHAVTTDRWNAWATLAVLLVGIDLVFLGKMFTYPVVASGLFRADLKARRPSVRPAVVLFALGLLFVVATALGRGIASADQGGFSLYSVVSEFVGVFASVGWAQNFAAGTRGFGDANAQLEVAYMGAVGHGLAIHPVAYFIGVAGDRWIPLLLLYCMGVLLILHVSRRIIGRDGTLLVTIVNLHHLMRHGPDIFVKNLIVQFVAVAIVFYVGKEATFRHAHIIPGKGEARV